MKIDGRKTTTSLLLDNGDTLEISKFCGMYTIKVVDANRLMVAELANLVSKDDAQVVASNYIDAA